MLTVLQAWGARQPRSVWPSVSRPGVRLSAGDDWHFRLLYSPRDQNTLAPPPYALRPPPPHPVITDTLFWPEHHSTVNKKPLEYGHPVDTGSAWIRLNLKAGLSPNIVTRCLTINVDCLTSRLRVHISSQCPWEEQLPFSFIQIFWWFMICDIRDTETNRYSVWRTTAIPWTTIQALALWFRLASIDHVSRLANSFHLLL